MNRLAFSFLFWMLAFDGALAAPRTPWETYMAHPSPENAMAVQSIQYSDKLDSRRLGEQISADIQVLAVQVFSADREAFRLTLRLIRSSKPGANLEDLVEIAGRYLRQNPKAYLEDVATSGLSAHCPGASYVGLQYVDRDTARSYEIGARVKALESVRDEKLAKLRDICLSQIGR